MWKCVEANAHLLQFPHCTRVHFGMHATQVLCQHRHLLRLIKQRIDIVYLAVEDIRQLPADLPTYCVLTVPATRLIEDQEGEVSVVDVLQCIHKTLFSHALFPHNRCA